MYIPQGHKVCNTEYNIYSLCSVAHLQAPELLVVLDRSQWKYLVRAVCVDVNCLFMALAFPE